MMFEEFLAKVRSEPDRTEDRDVYAYSPELVAEIAQRQGMRLDELLADPRCTIEQRRFRAGHVLGPPVPADVLSTWRAAWPDHPLPQDLVELLGRVDGIHLWADLDTGRSYYGLAPVADWQLARTCLWGPNADPEFLSDRYLGLSYHQNGDEFIVLNVDTGKYFLMEPYEADESRLVGASVAELLDWLWDHRAP